MRCNIDVILHLIMSDSDASIKNIDMTTYCAAVQSHLIARLKQEEYTVDFDTDAWKTWYENFGMTHSPIRSVARVGNALACCMIGYNKASEYVFTSIVVEKGSQRGTVQVVWTARRKPPTQAEQDKVTDEFFAEHINNDVHCARALLYRLEQGWITEDSVRRAKERFSQRDPM
jgi:hypothetical protein